MKTTIPTLVDVRIELFGLARIISGRRQLEITVPARIAVGELVYALTDLCPELVGRVTLEDRSGLHDSYIFNLNGTKFVSDDCLQLQPGDAILLFSSQAGG